MVSANLVNNVRNSNTRMSYGIIAKSAMMESAMDSVAPSIFSGNTDISVEVYTTFELK